MPIALIIVRSRAGSRRGWYLFPASPPKPLTFLSGRT